MTEPPRSETSWNTIKRIVWQRANGCCEYCQTSEANTGQTMQVDHIDPDGGDGLENLCLSCWNCNSHKHAATQGVNPETGDPVSLFNPRTQIWADHFEWVDGATKIRGRTPVGSATVARLKMNRPVIMIARQRWTQGGYHPPPVS